MESNQDNLFDQAMSRYQAGEDVKEVLKEFEKITSISPNQSAGWTCLAWLQLLCDLKEDALRSARMAVRLNGQDPQARVNLSLALLETNSKGVRDHIEFVKKALMFVPEVEKELKISIEDGLSRKPEWQSLKKIKTWLDF
ncbi:tetratricopeptide repeat protein [Prochlorococcus marinus]|uniref:TPR-repeat protein n=1 Tax=Prochlorococcus marinus (strain MIT 9211) TaxID=93059 RepID=A9BCX6_PROM4|nr:hypothetical protein [Prochlorococcus marinus]ABX08064.1 conserved hypothetical protein [Prochlorococcus marinus str. MIT 9211]